MRSLLAVCACLGLVALAWAEPPGRMSKGPPRLSIEAAAEPADLQTPITVEGSTLAVLNRDGGVDRPEKDDVAQGLVELTCHKRSRSRNPEPAPDEGNGGGSGYGNNFQRYVPTCEPPEAVRQANGGCPCTCGNCCCKQQRSNGTSIYQAPAPAPFAAFSTPPVIYGGYSGGAVCSDGSCSGGSCANGSCGSCGSSRSRRSRR